MLVTLRIQSFIGIFKMKKVAINYSITQSEVLTRCLVLALTAPNDEKAAQAAELAEQLAKGLTMKQVNQCKKAAMAQWEAA
jgi:hypothetical protein